MFVWQGIAVKVEQAFGLPAAMFTNALVYINSGTGTVDGLGGDKKMVTSVRSFDSQQKSPRWLDEPTVSQYSARFVQIMENLESHGINLQICFDNFASHGILNWVMESQGN